MAQLQEMKHNHGKPKIATKGSTTIDSSKDKNDNGTNLGKTSSSPHAKSDKSFESHTKNKGNAKDLEKPSLTLEQKVA